MTKKSLKSNLVFLDAGTLDYGDISFLEWEALGVLTLYKTTSSDRQAASRLRLAEQVISNKYVLNRELLQKLPRLRAIHVTATGVNNVDLKAAREAGVAVTNTAGYSTESVVQLTFSFLLALAGNTFKYDSAVRKGAWSRSRFFMWSGFPVSEIHGKTLGIIGYGTIGRRVAEVGKAFGLKIIIGKIPGRKYPASEARRISFEELLKKSDFITIHAPLTESTRSLIDEKAFRKIRPTAYLINMARGGIVDEAALLKALKNKQIAGAATDVLEQEPPRRNHPLLKAPNLIVTPHMGWASLESRRRLIHEVAENIKAFSAGRKRNRII